MNPRTSTNTRQEKHKENHSKAPHTKTAEDRSLPKKRLLIELTKN